MDNCLRKAGEDLVPDTTHLRVWNVDNYNHSYFRKAVTTGRDHERFDGNYTGYGYTLTRHPTGNATKLPPGVVTTTCVWPKPHGFATQALYDPVVSKCAAIFDSAKWGSSCLLDSPPQVLARFETPLGHQQGPRATGGLRFHPVDLFNWDISGQAGLVSTLQEASKEALADRNVFQLCRCDENIYRRICKLLSSPGGDPGRALPEPDVHPVPVARV